MYHVALFTSSSHLKPRNVHSLDAKLCVFHAIVDILQTNRMIKCQLLSICLVAKHFIGQVIPTLRPQTVLQVLRNGKYDNL